MGVPTDGLVGASGERLELRISISSDGREIDVLVSASSDDRVQQLARTAAEELGGDARLGLWCERRGKQLDGETQLGMAGIRWGDRLLLVPAVKEPTQLGGRARVELAVTGGPCVGERFELGDGAYRVGRQPGVDVCIADRSLSRHHLDVLVEPAGVRVADAGSSNGTALNGEALLPRSLRALSEHDELELGRTLVRVRSLRAGREHGVAQRDGRLDFNRPPRVNPAVAAFERKLASPPSRGRKARLPLTASLVPLGAGLLLFLLLKSPVMLAIAGLSPLMAIGTYVSDRRGGRRSFARESADFRATVDGALGDLDTALAEEALTRRAEAPDAPALIERLSDLAPTLWERRPADSDFLHLRIGVADLPARGSLSLEDGGDPELRAWAQEKLSKRKTLPSIPLTLDIRTVGVVGLTGARAASVGLARWLVLQATLLHSPGELVLIAALTPASAQDWLWLKWLPHLRPDRLGLQVPAIAVGRLQAERLLGEIREFVGQRRAQARAFGGAGQARPPAQLLILIDEETEVDRALVSAALADVAEYGVAAIWLGRDARDLPGQTGAMVAVEEERAVLRLTDVASGSTIGDVSAEALPLDLADRAARLLAPIRDISELARAGDIPRRVGLLDLLELLPPSVEALERRWAQWQGELCATVGVGAEGALTLDLRNEGPHALIAGTTGSGKSELLRTLVAAAAAAAPPHRLSFLLVDYKGGAAFAPCATLPHVLDIVSDLDEHLAERALISLNAELKRRERILADHGARDLRELMRSDPRAAPPLLVIAVDEFAKLREEVPQFVDGVVDIAQRGRSLGVHMVLAAQTLRNAFTPAIRANTNLRLALRVAEESESEDMIASPLAARIPSGENSRGRTFARTGHGELREFQAAYVSGRSDAPEQQELRVSVYDLDAIATTQAPSTSDTDRDADSDLVVLGEAARRAQVQMGLPVPVAPWLPTLPLVLDLEEIAARASDLEEMAARAPSPPGAVAIGLVDLPQLQRQDPLVIDLKQVGHVAVFGAGNSGKTTALTSTGLALARLASPDELSIYGLDAGGGALEPLQFLPHCGGVVSVDDQERVQRLLRLLLRRIERRAPDGAAKGSFEAWPAGSGQGSPGAAPKTTVLMLDDFGSFAHQYDRPGLESPYEQLQQILAGGRAAGVHVILTASRRGALPAVFAAHIGQRLVLRMPSEEDMLSFGLDAKTVRGARLPVGRGFTQDSREFHIAIPVQGGAPLPPDRAAGMVARHTTARAAPIERLPTHVRRDSLERSRSINRVILGVSDEQLEPAALDLADMHLLVVGPYRSGRSTALATIAHGLCEADPSADLHLLALRRGSPLRDLDIWSSAATSADACAESAASLLRGLETGEDEGQPAFVFIDDGGELGEAKVVAQLERLVRVARDSSLRVLAAVETGSARGIGNGWIRELRREGHGLLLQPDLAADGDLLATRLPRRVAAPLTPGRGFIVVRGTAELIQVAS